MEINKMTTTLLRKRLLKLESKIPEHFPLLKGSITIIGGENKQPRFSVNKKGKTYSTYLGKHKEKIARQYLHNYHKLMDIINDISEINLEIIRRMEVPRVKKSS